MARTKVAVKLRTAIAEALRAGSFAAQFATLFIGRDRKKHYWLAGC